MADGVNHPGSADLSGATGDLYIQPPTTHQESPSAHGPFGKIPAELRTMIYEEAFKGSEMTLLSTPRGDPQAYPRGGRRSAFFSSGHHHLLLTCRYIYNDARTMYWISTTVVNGEKDHRFSVTYLLNHLPQFAMPYIQSLRGLVMGHKWSWTKSAAYLPDVLRVRDDDRQLRERLPNLKTFQNCEITWSPRYIQFISDIQAHKNVLKEIYANCPPIFDRSNGSLAALWRIRVVRTVWMSDLAGSSDKAAFISSQTGRIWISDDPEISDAEGFARVLHGGSKDKHDQGMFLKLF